MVRSCGDDLGEAIKTATGAEACTELKETGKY